ncbi:hypothetical protein NUW58_g9610 [Xylaria curta]|uniref:Uncharacterized protein n=1 Tax=Xylaria curta TaxID=42375 RepID=A0ACC1MWI3_9PEZI|nr:hypothetical protein NUW58_g9610 [Xylaria curta]
MSAISSAPTTTTTCRDFADNEELLLYLYADLSRLSEFASEDIIIHPVHDHQQLIQGIEAAQAHENALIEGTGGTLVMDVEFVEAYPEVGVVAGVLRGRKGGAGGFGRAFPAAIGDSNPG